MSLEPREFLIGYLAFLFSTTLHEFGHAKIGARLGSRTAEAEGLVTLNPLPHIKRSPFGMVAMPFIGVALMGWIWPLGWASAPYDPGWAARHPRKMAWMTLAGPGSNFTIAVLAAVTAKILLLAGVLVIPDDATLSWFLVPAAGDTQSALGALGYGLGTLIFMNLALGIFNLLPIPPLDGSGVLEGFFPRQTAPVFDKIRAVPIIGLGLFLLAFNYAWHVIQPALFAVARLLM